jgi:hypothetical protein
MRIIGCLRVSQPGKIDVEVCSLLVDYNVDVELTQGGQLDTINMMNYTTGEAARPGGGDPQDQPPLESEVRRCSKNFRAPAVFWIL